MTTKTYEVVPTTPRTNIKVGQVVALNDANSNMVYRVMDVTYETLVTLVDINDATPNGQITYAPARVLIQVPQYQGEELWIQVSMFIAASIARIENDSLGEVVTEDDLKQLRHRCYKLIGGNHIKVDDSVRDRVRTLCDKALEVMSYL